MRCPAAASKSSTHALADGDDGDLAAAVERRDAAGLQRGRDAGDAAVAVEHGQRVGELVADEDAPAGRAASCGSRPVRARVTAPPGSATWSSASASSAGTSTGPPARRARGGAERRAAGRAASTVPLRRPRAPARPGCAARRRPARSRVGGDALRLEADRHEPPVGLRGERRRGGGLGGGRQLVARRRAAARRASGEQQHDERRAAPCREDGRRRIDRATTAPCRARGGSCRRAAFAVDGATTVAVGLWLARHDGRELGLPYPPFVGRWDAGATAWALARRGAARARDLGRAAAALARCRPPRSPPRCSRSRSRCGSRSARRAAAPASWARVFDPDGFEGPNEYLPALAALRYGPGFFLDRFAELVPALPVHAAGHPPGLLLVDGRVRRSHARAARGAVHRRRRAGRAARLRARAATLLDERRARIAGAADRARAVGAAVRRHLGRRAVRDARAARRRGRWRRGAPAARRRRARCSRSASLFAWSLLAVGAWAALLAWRRDGLRAMLALGAALRRGPGRLHAVFAALTGFDPIGTLRATEQVYRFGIAARAAVLVLADGLADRVPAHARAADRLARPARARAPATTPRSRSSP